MRALNDRTDPISRALLIQLARNADPGRFEDFIGSITYSIGMNHMSDTVSKESQSIMIANGYYQALIEKITIYHNHSAAQISVVSLAYTYGSTNIDGRSGSGIKLEIPEALKQKHISMIEKCSLKLGHIVEIEGLKDQPVVELLGFAGATIYKIKPFKPVSWNRAVGLARKQIKKS